MTETDRLFCKAGEHYWNRPKQKGARPFNCPEHAVVKPAPKPKKPKPVQEVAPVPKPKPKGEKGERANERIWREVIASAGYASCHCDLKPNMTYDELRFPGCKSPYFICPTLDKYRRLLGHKKGSHDQLV